MQGLIDLLYVNICTTEVPADENSLDAHWPETWADLWSLGKRQIDYDANGFSGIFRTGQLAGQRGLLKRLPKLLASILVKSPGLLIGLNVPISIILQLQTAQIRTDTCDLTFSGGPSISPRHRTIGR